MKKLLFVALSALLFVSCGDNNNAPQQQLRNPYFYAGQGKMIQFSPGLLQYDTVQQTYRFASSQLVLKESDDCINQFVWGHGEDPLFHSNNPEDYATFNDWGDYPIDKYRPGTWRTLSTKEWDYILNYRPQCGELIAFANIEQIGGILLLPNNWMDVEDVAVMKGLVYEYLNENNFSIEQWKKLELAGAVFLPYTAENDIMLPYFHIGESTLWASASLDGSGNGLVRIGLFPSFPYFASSHGITEHKDYVRLVKKYEHQN